MSSPYDQNLLDEAPKATRAQLQEGYNVDLLEPPPPRRTPSVRTPPPPIPQPTPVTVPLTPGIAETGSREKFASSPSTPAALKSRTSFWRTRNGAIAIAIIVIIVVGAVVGGAVGGTVKKNSNVQTTGTDTTTSSSSFPLITSLSAATSGSQGIGGITRSPEASTITPSSSAATASQTGSNIGMEIGNGGMEGIAG